MDERTKLILKQKYAVLPDEELISIISAGKDEYEPEAYDLLLSEARRRGIEETLEDNTAGAGESVVPAEGGNQGSENQDQLQTFVQLVIVVNDNDRNALESILDKAGMSYYFQELNIRGKAGPTGLMVEQSRVEDAIELLSRCFKPAGSLILW